jgi:RNase H-fold protein (predicted Holliday junction resolvase)
MARKSEQDKLAELESRYAKALETIERMAQQQAQMAAQLGASSKQYSGGQLVVGIRNVSNYSVGLIDKTSGQAIEYNLNPEIEGSADPRTSAVVSYAFWQQLRTGNQVGRGLIVRDDSILGPAENAAPEDRPQDVHPDHAKNVIMNVREWILSRTEDQLREDITAMTSEPSLRRLQYAVDQEILRIGESKYNGDPERARKAIRDLPAVFRVVEELADERLDELNPVSKVRHLELEGSLKAR